MIRTRDLVPEVYYNKSRDFQALGRVFEIVYNYAKTGTDLIRNSYEDVKMLDLFAKTIGFNSKHNYNTEDLLTLCNTFITILKNKGSKKSVELSVIALLKAQHLEDSNYYIEDVVDAVTQVKQHSLDIYVPKELTDIILLEDLFDYILPAGYTYRFIPARFNAHAYITQLTSVDRIKMHEFYDSNKMAQVGVTSNSVSTNYGYNIVKPTIDNSVQQLGISYASVVYKPE